MIRPIELLNTLLLVAIAVLLAIQVFGPAPERGVIMQGPQYPTVPCRVQSLFGGGEELTCIPVRMLDAP